MLNFKVAPSDFALIYAISKRALALLKERDNTKAHIQMEMDLEAVHNYCCLRLADLLGANDFDFVHEIVGIRENFIEKPVISKTASGLVLLCMNRRQSCPGP